MDHSLKSDLLRALRLETTSKLCAEIYQKTGKEHYMDESKKRKGMAEEILRSYLEKINPMNSIPI